MAKSLAAFAEEALALFENEVLGKASNAEVIDSDTYYHETQFTL